MAAVSDIASLLLGYTANPGVEHVLCACITRTGILCKGVRAHEPGKVVFDVERWPEHPGQPRIPAVYTLEFDPATGQPKRGRLE